jgi:hypothetical protein
MSTSPLLANAVTQLVPRLHAFLTAYEKEGWNEAAKDTFLLMYMFCWPVFSRMGMDGGEDSDRARHMSRMVGRQIAGDTKWCDEDIPSARALVEVLCSSEDEWVCRNAKEALRLLTPPERRE